MTMSTNWPNKEKSRAFAWLSPIGYFAIGTILLLFGTVALAQPAESIFWTSSSPIPTAKIEQADLDGSNRRIFFIGDLEDPEGVIVDPIRATVYWVDENISRIRRAAVDGTLLSSETEIGDLFGLAIDPIKRNLYWSNATEGVIVRANLETTDQIEIVTGLPVNAPQGLALDRKANRIYWVDFAGGKIMSADLTDPGVHVVVRSGLSHPVDVALDLSNQHIYWSERGPGPIRRGDLNSYAGHTDVVTGIQPSGIALDVQNATLYWTDSVVDAVSRINFNGTGKYQIASVVDPFGISVFRQDAPIVLLQALVNEGLDLNLSKGISKSLGAKLESALQVLDDINENNDVAAINSLNAFINAVMAQSGKAIDENDAVALIQYAEAVIDALSL